MRSRLTSIFFIRVGLCLQFVILAPLAPQAAEEWGEKGPQSRKPVVRSRTPPRQKRPDPAVPQARPVDTDMEMSNGQVRLVIIQKENGREVIKIMMMGKPKDLILELVNQQEQTLPENREMHDALREAIKKLVSLAEDFCVFVSEANVKEKPDLQSATVAVVLRGSSMAKLEEQSGWISVRLRSGETGWILKELVRECPTVTVGD